MAPRSFLFASDHADVATTGLIATAAAATGFMKGEPGPARADWYALGSDNGSVLAQLHAALAATYPAAGPALWAVRLWTNLIWQPAYLAVIAVHLYGAVPDFSGMSQQRRGIYIDGFRLEARPMRKGDTASMLADAAAQLKPLTDAMLAEVNALVKLRPLPARRLLADRMLGLMVWLSHRRRDLSSQQVEAYAAQWLDGLGLSGQGTLEAVSHGNDRLLIVRRKGCCLDYLLDPQALCASCPRQDETVRIARQTANALAERA